jgi:hypothetical protein
MKAMKPSVSLEEIKRSRSSMQPLESRRQSYTGANKRFRSQQPQQEKQNQKNLSLIKFALGRHKRQNHVAALNKNEIHKESPTMNTSIAEAQKYFHEKAKISSHIVSSEMSGKVVGHHIMKPTSKKLDESLGFVTFEQETEIEEDNCPHPSTFTFEVKLAPPAPRQRKSTSPSLLINQHNSTRSIISYLESLKTNDNDYEDHTNYGIDDEYDPKLHRVSTINASNTIGTTTTIPVQPFVAKLSTVMDKKKRNILSQNQPISSSNVGKKTTQSPPPPNKIKKFLQSSVPNRLESFNNKNVKSSNQYTIFNDPEIFDAMNHSFISLCQGSINDESSVFMSLDDSERFPKSLWITNRRFEC